MRTLGVLIILVTGLTALMIFSQDAEVRRVDISALQDRAGEVIVGDVSDSKSNTMTVASFLGKSYDYVILEGQRSSIAYLGISKGNPPYYAYESVSVGFTQEIKEVKIDGEDLIIIFGKDIGMIVLLPIFFAGLFFIGYMIIVWW